MSPSLATRLAPAFEGEKIPTLERASVLAIRAELLVDALREVPQPATLDSLRRALERRAIVAGDIGKELVLAVVEVAETEPDLPLETFLTLRGR